MSRPRPGNCKSAAIGRAQITVAHIACDRKRRFTGLEVPRCYEDGAVNAISNGHVFVLRNDVKMSGLNGRAIDRSLNRSHLSLQVIQGTPGSDPRG
jgi:hypothetical protein